MTDLAQRVLELAATQVGVREHGRNRGPEIDGYCRTIAHDPAKADPWCAIFVCAMVRRAADQLGVPEPFRPTAGCYTLDEQAPPYMRSSVPAAGAIFVTQGHRHTGLIEAVNDDGSLQTIEGNTNDGGSPDGDGVYRRTRQRREMLCFVDLNREPVE